jgi:hypothetical protein
MIPSATIYNMPNQTARNAKQAGELGFYSNFARFRKIENFNHVFCGKYGIRVLFSAQNAFGVLYHSALLSFRVSRPFLALHINNIFCLCSSKQVRGVYTKPIISAWTIMQYAWLFFCDFISSNQERDSMGCLQLSVYSEAAVAISPSTTSPEPARFSFFNLLPKSFQIRFRKVDGTGSFCDVSFSVLHSYVCDSLAALRCFIHRLAASNLPHFAEGFK